MTKFRALLIPAATAITASFLTGCVQLEELTDDTTATTNTQQNNATSEYTTDANTNTTTVQVSGGTIDEAKSAVALAISTSGGGVVTDLDYDDDQSHWDVSVYNANQEYSYEINLAGTAVLFTEPAEAAEIDDTREYELAKIEITQAIDAAITQTPGLIHDVSLETLDGQTMWRVTVRPDGSALPVRILVDASTGKIA